MCPKYCGYIYPAYIRLYYTDSASKRDIYLPLITNSDPSNVEMTPCSTCHTISVYIDPCVVNNYVIIIIIRGYVHSVEVKLNSAV